MKQFTLILFCLFQLSNVIGQTNDSLVKRNPKELNFDICLTRTPIIGQAFWGLNIDAKYFPINKFGTGLYFNCSEKSIKDTFQFVIEKPIMDFYEIGWINQYNFIQKKKFRLNFNLINGIAYSRLGDKSKKEYMFNGNLHIKGPLVISCNYYYLLEPGLDISYKIVTNHGRPDFYLTAKAKYRILFGDSKYSSTDQFSNYLIAIGISLIGFDK